MSNLDLRIELPAYSRSFDIHVPSSSTIQQVKEEISRTCPGYPRIEGQRLIWRGRILANEENVSELWKSPTDSRTLHLAVHPSAWAGDPPDISTPRSPALDDISSVPLPNPLHMDFPLEQPTLSSSSRYRAIPYIASKHQNALKALATGVPPLSEDSGELRQAAKVAIEKVGWAWPAVLDEPYPQFTPGGLGYQRIVINGQQYLSLADASSPPTAVQKHALSILSYTFTLLNLSVASSTIIRTHTSFTTTSPIPPQVNQVLRQYGLPQIHVINANPNQEQNPIPQIRDVPLRPLLMPLFMLLFRTLLLLYFVAPTRKPIFGILILAWMLYEIWQPIRNGLLRFRIQRINIPNPQNPGAAQGLNNVPPQAAVRPPPAANAQGQGPVGNFGVRQMDGQATVILDTLGNLNLQAEQDVLNRAHLGPVPEPTLGHKIASFFGLLFSTLHPAIWDRRRAALRRREGTLRTEANMRREPPRDPEEEETEDDRRAAQSRQELREQHARRPPWIQRWMERVVEEEWVDDLD